MTEPNGYKIRTAKSILTMTYFGSGNLPRRVKAIANTPKTSPTYSLVVNPDDHSVYKTIEEIHAFAAWQLATQLSWIFSDDGDLIPAKIHRVGTTGIGEDVTLWTLKENITARKMLANR